MRAAGFDRRLVPVGVNLAPPLRFWKLSGGAQYLPDEDAVLLTAIGATVTSPWFRAELPKATTWQEEWWRPADAPYKPRLMTSQYAHADQSLSGANGNATVGPTVAGGWAPTSYTLAAVSAIGMTGSIYQRVIFQVTSVYGVPGSKVRNPRVSIAR